jgi:hypothetical protein
MENAGTLTAAPFLGTFPTENINHLGAPMRTLLAIAILLSSAPALAGSNTSPECTQRGLKTCWFRYGAANWLGSYWVDHVCATNEQTARKGIPYKTLFSLKCFEDLNLKPGSVDPRH